MRILEAGLLQELLEKYGEDEQIRQAVGEMGEFIAVAQNYHRARIYGHRSEQLADLMNEAADVYFMIQQVRAIDPALFDQLCHLKELKVLRKLDNENPIGKKGEKK